MKVMTIIGTRPEIIKLSEVIKKFDKNTEHILVHTGQNYDYNLNEIFFKDLGLRKPDYFLEVVGKSLGETLGNIMSKSEEVMLKEKPDALLILGDTNSALSAIIAKRLKIPVFHMEAGNRSFDERVPEEINRRLVDHISDVNIVYTRNQYDYLIMEGLPKDRLFISGSPMPEILEKNSEKESNILETLKLEKQKYFVVSVHREENLTDEKMLLFLKFLNDIAEKYTLPIIVTTHPRTRKYLDNNIIPMHNLIKFMKPFNLTDYIALQTNSLCVISDSGTIAEESSILGFKAITIREAIERPEAFNSGCLIMSSTCSNEILKNLEIELNSRLQDKCLPEGYTDTNFSEKILRIVLSYTDYINKKVWYK